MVRIFEQDGEHFHPRRLGFARTHLKGPLESSLAIGSVFAHLRLGVGIASQMQSKIPQQLVIPRSEKGDGQGQQLPSLHKGEGCTARFAVCWRRTARNGTRMMEMVRTGARRRGQRWSSRQFLNNGGENMVIAWPKIASRQSTLKAELNVAFAKVAVPKNRIWKEPFTNNQSKIFERMQKIQKQKLSKWIKRSERHAKVWKKSDA